MIISIFLLIIFNSLGNCQETYEYKISGTVVGKDSGELVILESQRAGDEIIIPIKQGYFSYEGRISEIFITPIWLKEDQLNAFLILTEPGEIIIELSAENLSTKSKIVKGELNIKFNRIREIGKNYWIKSNKSFAEYKAVYGDSIEELIRNNLDNFIGVYLLMGHSDPDFSLFNDEKLGQLLKEVKSPELRNSLYFKEIYSRWLARTNKTNEVGQKATNFILPDSTGNLIEFDKINIGKLIYVENSGSWCGYSTNRTLELLESYKNYEKYGFEIITIVNEYKLDRWKDWLKQYKFPWINLVELERQNTNDFFYSDLLFNNGSFLADTNGIVIETNLSATKLNNILMERFEPKKYKEYLANVNNLPDGTKILDKEIKSFKELSVELSGKAIFIDCWASWCPPCVEEFKYNALLKAYLDANNIEMVYLNFNKNIEELVLLSYIHKYTLIGTHLKVNESLINELIDLGYNNTLPTYIIVNYEGKIVNINAARPSEKEKLFNQIRTELIN